MSDQSLDIIIRTIAEGNGAKVTTEEVQKLKAATMGAGEEAKAAGNALNRLADENIARVRAATAGATEAQKENTEELEKSKSSHVGMGMAVTAAWAAMVGALKNYLGEVSQAGMAAEEFSKIETAASSLDLVHTQLATSAAAFARSYGEVTNAIKLQTDAINAQVSAMQTKARIEEKLNDATTNANIKRIQASSATPEQKAIAIEEQMNQARKVKEDNRLKAELAKADADRAEQIRQAKIAETAKAAADALQPEVEAAKSNAIARGAEAGGVTKFNATEIGRNAEMIELVRTLMQNNNPDSLAGLGVKAMSPKIMGDLLQKFGGGVDLASMGGLEGVLKSLTDENAGLEAGSTSASRSAANAQNRATTVAAEQKRLQEEALAAKKKSEDLAASTAIQYQNIQLEKNARPAIDAQNDAASEAVKKKARDDAARKEQKANDALERQMERDSAPGGFFGPPKSGRGRVQTDDGASISNAANDAVAANREANDAILEGFAQMKADNDNLRSRINDLLS